MCRAHLDRRCITVARGASAQWLPATDSQRPSFSTASSAMARSWGVLLLGLMIFRTLSFVSFAPKAVPRSVKVLRQATATDETMGKACH
eukprot:Skav208779  [mRNA]  locus=scaffold2301:293778:300167:- [translate_table: standard]